jgi:diacylglycerol kinase (ATP)
MSNSARGLDRLRKACGYSLKGLVAGWRHEEAFRQEVLLVAALLPCAGWLGRTTFECMLLVSTLFLVVITELLNSAIEALTDRVGEERHELSGRAKDMASAAVFLALVLVAVVWGSVAWARWASG